jgi:hypothetical protein
VVLSKIGPPLDKSLKSFQAGYSTREIVVVQILYHVEQSASSSVVPIRCYYFQLARFVLINCCCC